MLSICVVNKVMILKESIDKDPQISTVVIERVIVVIEDQTDVDRNEPDKQGSQ